MTKHTGLSALVVCAIGLALPTPAAHAGAMSFEDFVIEGEVLKPEVTVVISRENLNKAYDLELKESFLQKIIDSVNKAPF